MSINFGFKFMNIIQLLMKIYKGDIRANKKFYEIDCGNSGFSFIQVE
jgi:hypothetical protein